MIALVRSLSTSPGPLGREHIQVGMPLGDSFLTYRMPFAKRLGQWLGIAGLPVILLISM